MDTNQEQKLNDQIAFCNSIGTQFLAFKGEMEAQLKAVTTHTHSEKDEAELKLGRLREDLSRLEAENKELKTLIDANRSWVAICDTAIKELRVQINLIVKGPSKTEGPLSVKPVSEYKHLNWRKFWK